jgi:hypothetical protein
MLSGKRLDTVGKEEKQMTTEARQVEVSKTPERRGSRLRPWLVIVLTAVLLLLFINKAMTIDEPLFIWTAHHLQTHPVDPYGFETNWFGVPSPMLTNVQNPPLTSYWLALVGLVSWNEWWLHLTMLPFGLLTVWGTMRLARLVGADPFWAGLLTVATAGFLISATTVMCDVTMTCGFVWTIVLWIEGMNRKNAGILVAAAVVAGLTVFTKYFGLALVPLLVTYTIFREKQPTRTLWPLAVTVAMVLAWHSWTENLYGMSHMLEASNYASHFKEHFDTRDKTALYGRYFSGVAFLGGCILWPLVVALGRGGWLGRILLAASLLLGGVMFDELYIGKAQDLHMPMTSYLLGAVFFAAGVAVFWLLGVYWWRNRRKPEAWLLGLWSLGTIIFLIFVNWTVAARSLLPLIPALGVMAAMGKGGEEEGSAKKNDGSVRHVWDKSPPTNKDVEDTRLWPPVMVTAGALGLAVALAATWADADWAEKIRDQAARLTAEYKAQGKEVYFQGHWGWQYYMQLDGGQIADSRVVSDPRIPAPANGVMFIPANNCNWALPSQETWRHVGTVEDRSGDGIYVMDTGCNAGYYSHILGLLPLAYTSEKPDKYYIFEAAGGPPREARPIPFR